MSDYQQEFRYGEDNQVLTMQKFFMKIFAWMFLGLFTTGAVGLGLVMYVPTNILIKISNAYLIIVIAELVLVWYLSAKILQMDPIVAKLLFFVYACMNGVMVMLFTVALGIGSVVIAFGISCVFFGIMALIGATTKADLSKLGPMLIAGVIAVAVLLFVNMFLRLSGLDFILCLAGLGLFFALTAYDVNKLKKTYYYVSSNNPEISGNIAILGALTLYLDFINIFIFVLRLLSRKK